MVCFTAEDAKYCRHTHIMERRRALRKTLFGTVDIVVENQSSRWRGSVLRQYGHRVPRSGCNIPLRASSTWARERVSIQMSVRIRG